MSRVWKHFLKNISLPFGIMAYVLLVTVGAQYLNHNYGDSVGLLFFGATFVIPILSWLIRDMWRDAKEKVEDENRDMMRRIKGDS